MSLAKGLLVGCLVSVLLVCAFVAGVARGAMREAERQAERDALASGNSCASLAAIHDAVSHRAELLATRAGYRDAITVDVWAVEVGLICPPQGATRIPEGLVAMSRSDAAWGDGPSSAAVAFVSVLVGDGYLGTRVVCCGAERCTIERVPEPASRP